MGSRRRKNIFIVNPHFKYVADHEFPLSPYTGKSPWVTLNGEELHDSQLIVEALTRKFGKDCK